MLEGVIEAKRRKLQGGTPPNVHETILGLLGPFKDGNKVLDAMTFRGELANKLKRKGFVVFACDLYPEEFEAEDIDCRSADLNIGLPYEDSTFSSIVLCEAIEHLENPWHVIREAYRVLKPGGQLILSTPNILSLLSRFLFFTKGVFLYFSEFEFRKPYHINPLTYNELKIILEGTGFKIDKVVGAGHQIPKIALLGLRVIQYPFLLITEAAFSIWVSITKQVKPQTNSLLNYTLISKQSIVIVALKDERVLEDSGCRAWD